MKRLLPLLVVVLASCNNFHYDQALRDQVAEEGSTKTKAWFAKHLPQATDLAVDIEYYVLWNYITNMTHGEFSVDSMQYEYLYNYETDSCLTNLRNGDLKKLIDERMKPYPDTDTYYYRVELPKMRLYGETISNQDQFLWTTHYDKPVRETISAEVSLYPFGITDSELAKLADKAVANRVKENYPPDGKPDTLTQEELDSLPDSTETVILGEPGV